MTCLLCGEACTCTSDDRLLHGGRSVNALFGGASSDQNVADSPRPKFVVDDSDVVRAEPVDGGPPSGPGSDEIQPDAIPVVTSNDRVDPSVASLQTEAGASEAETWREEVSARLNRYRARRRPRAPRYPSLRLKFEPPPARPQTPACEEMVSSSHTVSTPLTCQALAMNPVETEGLAVSEVSDEAALAPAEPPRASQGFAKILEFPRWAYAPPVSLNELADPVVERPRILEVPEVVPPPPAMGGITIEDARPLEPERRPGIDMPLRSAPLGLRLWASLVDALIVLLACGVFAAVFYRIAGTEPPLWEMIGGGVGLGCILWAAYQYAFVVLCGTTLGLRAAHLRISRFDGGPVSRRSRRSRVLCSFLSGLSLGMGYAWQFLDEDALCWHERVTRTYLAPPA